MTREEKSNLLNELLEYEEKNDIGLLTRAERREFQQWISKALEQEPIKSVLEDIKTEIEKICNRENNTFDCLSALDELKNFIDKHMESEE